jgi:probable H4MPT-linked C1 transfer pathway protein
MILGLDIGGANTKAASSDGRVAESIYLPLWKGADLLGVLRRFAALEPEAVAAVITGELADCFASKRDGVERLRAAMRQAFSCPVHFWGVNGFGWKDSLELAAANWSASAAFVAREVGDCLFVDMGSTTTDLIPIRGRPMAAATDFQRLSRGELVYMGMLRTSLGALLPEARLRGGIVPLSPELFAITADAYLALGEIAEDGYTCEAPDGAIKSREAALRRLSRTVCTDLEELGEDGALAIAEQVRDRQMAILTKAIKRQAEEHSLSGVTAAGIGEGLIAEAAQDLDLECILLSERFGCKISAVFPAYAVARLLQTALEAR